MALSSFSPFRQTITAAIARIRGDRAVHEISVNAVWLIADRLYGLALSVIVTVVVARYLGPARFGVLSYAMAFIGLLAPIAQLGLDSIVVRDLVAEPDCTDEILGTAFMLMVGSGALLIPVALSAATFVSGSDRATTLILIAILSVQYVLRSFDLIDFWLRSRLQSRYAVISTKLGLTANAALSLWLIHAGRGVKGFACATILEIAVAMLGLVVFYYRNGGRMRHWRWSRPRAMQLLRAGMPLLVATFAGTLYSKAGFIIVREMTSNTEVGLFSAAVRISELFYFVPMAIVVSVFPTMVRSRAWLTDEEQARRTQALFDLTAILGYAVALPASILATTLLPLVFGASYAAAGVILAIHIWTFVFISIGMARSNWLVAHGRTNAYMISSCLGAIVHIGLSLALVPRFGAAGAAWAAVAAQAFIVFGSAFVVRGLEPMRKPVAKALAVPLRMRSAAHEWREIFEQRA